MDNAIAAAKRQKSDKYNNLVEEICRRFPNSNVRFRAMVVGVMGTVPASIKQTLHDIQPKAQTSWVIHQIIQAIGNHNHKLQVTRDQMHNRRINFPNEHRQIGSTVGYSTTQQDGRETPCRESKYLRIKVAVKGLSFTAQDSAYSKSSVGWTDRQ